MNRIQAQAVQVKLFDPVACVGNEELPHRAAALAVEVDRFPPRRVVAVGEVGRGEEGQEVAVGAHVVVDNVQDHTESQAVRPVDERAEIIRSAVEAGGSEEVDPVVTPAVITREVGHGHDLYSRYAQITKSGQLLSGRGEGSFR